MDKIENSHSTEIDGVIVKPLKQIKDERGAVLHMLRCDSPLFRSFGEIYFSVVLPGVVKAWKCHKRMTQHFAVPVGKIQLTIYDDRSNSPTKEKLGTYIIGQPDHYNLVCIPPLVWYGFKAISDNPALIANCTDIPHDPEEVAYQPLSSNIPNVWKL